MYFFMILVGVINYICELFLVIKFLEVDFVD